MTTNYDFHVCLDHLAALRRTLADLETTLTAPHSHTWPTIDPRLHLGPAAWRTTKGDTASYVYGLLAEADPLGDTHTETVHRLEAWYHQIQETITAITTAAERTHATYTAADEATATAATKVTTP
ncbi:hypothetical protein GCM10009839_36830 [Catenulispora yoronensis]|uniref:Uncharacterized protein n=1 Tax=Catenulispora yoronensis TaxID=450799 RepID=A0ABP5FSD3_9ACTN